MRLRNPTLLKRRRRRCRNRRVPLVDCTKVPVDLCCSHLQRQEDAHDHDKTTSPRAVSTSDADSREAVHHSPLPPSPKSHSGEAVFPLLSSDQMTSADQARTRPPCCAAIVERWVPIIPSMSPLPRPCGQARNSSSPVRQTSSSCVRECERLPVLDRAILFSSGAEEARARLDDIPLVRTLGTGQFPVAVD